MLFEPTDERNLQWDRNLAKFILGLLMFGVIFLSLDFPPPNPDFYVFVRMAEDLASSNATAEKYPPGLALFLVPFISGGTLVMQGAALLLNIFSFFCLGVGLLSLTKKLNLFGTSIIITGVMANRYTFGTAVTCSTHVPFLAATVACLHFGLSKNWKWAYLFAAIAFLFRYNGAPLPVLVAIYHVYCHWHDSYDFRSRAILFTKSALIVFICVLPVFLWLKFGTQIGIGSYEDEVSQRGQAGLSAVKYLPSSFVASFLDQHASEVISAGDKTATILAGMSSLIFGIFILIGVLRFTFRETALVVFSVLWLLWWIFVHMKFADVGGMYLYATQVVFLGWIFLCAGLFKEFSFFDKRIAFFAVPILMLSFALFQTIIATLLLIIVFMMYLQYNAKKSWINMFPVLVICSVMIASGYTTGKMRIYDSNYRAVEALFHKWAEQKQKILISPVLLEAWQMEGRNTENFISEENIDGNDIQGSIERLGIQYAAIGSWELEERDKPEFLPGVDFFLGSRYKNNLKPYRLLMDIADQKGWKIHEVLTARNSQITIYVKDNQ